MALKIEGFFHKSDYEIAKLCGVSQSFVASVRDPEKKKKQAAHKLKHAIKKVEAQDATSQTSGNETTVREDPNLGSTPDAEEMKVAERAMQADVDAMYKLLESDDALKAAHEEVKRLNYLTAQQEIRIHGLMNERNEAVKMLKKLQKENDKLKAKK